MSEPKYKYFEVRCFGEKDGNNVDCYLITTDESIARGFVMAQAKSVDGTDFKFDSISFEMIGTNDRMVL